MTTFATIMREALTVGRAALAEALTTHIYDEANGEKPEPDCQYVAAIAQMDAALAAATSADAFPDWVAGFLNRRTEVEAVLRKVAAGKREPLTIDECKALANRLSVPEGFGRR